MFLFLFSVYNIMKGGRMKEKVVLKFIGTGINDKYQACVRIYNHSGELLYNKETYNGKLILYFNKSQAYRLVAISNGDIIRNVFYVNNYNCEYIFYFKRILKKERTITFLLKDVNYDNLPIGSATLTLTN